ncbi:collagen alpha-1(I) chain [Macaca nemestrina]|uniref:collagen alpha-1(I) chain n=1 Tax=Macaca nemestrina TaxID=9545 RepID=UPI0039B980F1
MAGAGRRRGILQSAPRRRGARACIQHKGSPRQRRGAEGSLAAPARKGERKFQGQRRAAAAAAARGAASPAEVCRRAGKRWLLLPSLRIGEGGGSEGSAADTGREGGEAKERKGGGEKGRPGNHLRLPRPPRPAPAASGGPGASAHPAGAGAGAQSPDAHVAAPTPLGSPRAVGQSPRPPPGPGWSAVRAPRRRRRQDGRGQLCSRCSPAPLPTALRSLERSAPRGTPRAPRGLPVSPTSLLEGGQRFWAARVDLKENVFKCPVARGSVTD